MRFSCEVIVYEVLPIARRSLARELVEVYGMNQNQIAILFNVTGAAICQYMKGKRGENDLIEKGPYAEMFHKEISESAEKLANGTSNITTELCKICGFAKTSGVLNGIADAGPEKAYHKCHECPNKTIEEV